ncbi:MAG TPA: septum formation family protein [Pilimelia sp.]|nr:septum formation family protein [Pilimelia sp.]
MRRRPTGVAHGRSRRTGPALVLLGCLAALLLGGCAKPAGVDGRLTDDWVPVSEPKPFTPESGVCHATDYAESGSLATFNPVDCAQPHRTETFHVGTFTGAAAAAAAPPKEASAAWQATYAQCDQQARTFLGDDFREGRLWVGVVVPTAAGWRGGSRWYRCELAEIGNVEEYEDPVSRSGSLAGVLKAASPLRLTCYQVTAEADGSIGKMAAAACNRPHNSEFAGVYRAPAGSYPRTDAAWEKLHAGCLRVVGTYAKVPADANLKFRSGTVVVPNLPADWAAGNRGIRCYLYLSGAKLTRSLAGAGAAALPVR